MNMYYMRVFFAMLLSQSLAQILRVPRSGPSPMARPFHLFQHYDRDLPLPFLPLCGNGVLNTKEDYESMPAFQVGLFNIQLLVDEECDDGNRRDGDGCSADCMDVDSMVDPCPVRLPGSVRALAIDGVTGKTYVATQSQLTQWSVTTSGVVLEPLFDISIDSFVVENGVFFLFGSGRLQKWSVQLETILNVGTTEGHWITMKGVHYFLTHDSTTMWLMNTRTLEAKTFTDQSFPAKFSVCHADEAQTSVVCNTNQGTYQINSNIAFSRFTPEAYPNIPGLRAYMTLMTSTVNQMYFPARIPEIRGSNLFSLFSQKEVMVSSEFVVVSKSNVRSLLHAEVNAIFQVKPFQAIGNELLINVTRSMDFNCYVGEKCFLDIPFKGSMYDRNGGPSTTLLQELNVAIERNATTAFADFAKQLRDNIYYPATVAQHPNSKHFLILNQGQVYFVGRRGTALRMNDNTCLPHEVPACPLGHWGEFGTTCKPCSFVNDSIAHHFQCRYYVTRRRLLQDTTVQVAAKIEEPDEVLRLSFPEAEVQDGMVIIRSTDPPRSLQRMSAVLAANPQWIVLQRPVVLYETQAEVQVTDTNLVTIVGAVAGAVVLFLLIGFVMWKYKPVAKKTETTNTGKRLNYTLIRP